MTVPPADHVGAILRREREAAGLTLVQAGQAIDVESRTLRAYETMSRPPQWVVRPLLQLAEASILLCERVQRIYARESKSRTPSVVFKKNHHSPQLTPLHRRCSASGGSLRSEKNSGTTTE